MSARKIVGILCVAAAFSAGCASSMPRMERMPPGDARIEAELRAAIAQDEELQGENIEVTSHDGVVVVAGAVGTRDQVRRVLRLAGRVDGVEQVVNRLMVLPRG